MRLNIIANWMQGTALSGGDRIFIELSKRWASKINIRFFVSIEGWEICRREGLKGFNHKIWASDKFNKCGYFINYLYRTFISIVKSSRAKTVKDDIIYSSSDFWPDSIPAFIIKLGNPEVRWIAGFYLFAAPPWQKDSPYKKRFLTGLFYWLTQLPIYWLVQRYADMVFVTNELDVDRFITRKRGKDKIVVIRGGVDIRPSEEYLNSGKIVPLGKRRYDACFVGRFHYQKGVLELVDIWKSVCDRKPEAKLAMIGVGPLENEVRKKIAKVGQDNIELLGFKDGEEKYEIFKQSKIIVHPATYDSGGMAAAEGMAWGLPGVSFDLEALKTYYPKGMVKVQQGNQEEFSMKIIKLLEDKKYYEEISEEAINLIVEKWDWNKRANEIKEELKKCTMI